MAGRIRSFDWASTPLGPIARWPQSLKTIVDLMLGSPSMMSLVWGPEAIHLYNDRFTDLLREHRVLALGRSAYETFAQSRDVFEADTAAGMAGRSARLVAQRYPVLRQGRLEEAWFDVDYAPIRDEAGTVAGVLWTLKETTAQNLAEQALRTSEEKYRTLFDSIDEGFCLIEVLFDDAGNPNDYAFLETNAAFERQTGLAGATGKRMRELAPDLERHWFEIYGRIAISGEPQRFEQPAEALGRWYDVYAFRIGDPEQRRVAILFNDVAKRKQTERELRESEERQAFLLALSDALRPLADASEIQATAARLLGVHLGVDRAMYGEVTGEPGAETGVIRGQFIRPAAPDRPSPAPFPDRFTYETFGADVMARRYGGEGLVVADVNADPGFDASERAAWARVGVQAAIVAPLVKGDRLVAELGVHSERPRIWSSAEVSLVREVGERTWAAAERARAEAALRESEERFRQFAHAAAEGAWIRDAETLDMEYVSPAASRIYGVEPQTLLDGVQHWAGLIVPEDRGVALAHLEDARGGEVVAYEFRIQRPSDGAFRWIRSIDFPLFDSRGRVQRIGGLAEDFTEAKLAAEHSAVLLAELQHRVRNIMALLRSITSRTGERAESVADYRDLMMGRLLAFARVQALLTRTANVSVGIRSIVHDEVSVQAQHEGQYILDGPDVTLSPKAAEVLTLAIHELATNAAKYGALSVPTGRIAVRWSIFEKRGGPWLGFDWTEEGAPARSQPTPSTPRRRGFGSELIEGRIPYELRGRGQLTIEPGGAGCHLEFPLQGGASILETSAPQRATVFGGAIDMTGEPDLTGRRVLVVEDDYYLATDTARALRGAGAEVLGPCATEADARAELEEAHPDAVVVDINLGPGPSFKLAETLKDHGIPFVFTTGYDAEVIPVEFEGVERLEKPLQLRQIIGAVAKLTAAA